MENLFGAVVKFRIRALSQPSEIDQFIKFIAKIPSLDSRDVTEFFQALDRKLSLSDKAGMGVALAIQKEKPQDAVCTNSAHLYALDALNDKRKRVRFAEVYNELVPQGFPSNTDPHYIRTLTEALFKARLERSELAYVIQLFYRVPEYITRLVGAIIDETTSRQTDKWNELMLVAARKRNTVLDDAIIKECAKLKQGEKALSQMSDFLTTREARGYFQGLAQKSAEIIRSRKPQSGFGRMFGGKK